MPSKCLLRIVNDDIERSYKIVPDILVSVFCFCVTVFVPLSSHHMEVALVLLV